jgi:uncharacterized protein (DUF427 family)
MKAIWKGKVIAESDKTIIIESNHYFPRNSISSEYFSKSDTTTHCPWKGDASYFSVTVDGETNQDAAWYYPAPKEAANEISGMVAFWRGVEVSN